MKKLITLFIIVFTFSFAQSVTAKCDVNLREKPSAKSSRIGYMIKGEELTIKDSYAAYIKIEVVGESKHIGKTGYMYVKYVGDGVVTGKGCTLRSSPEKIADDTPDDTSDDHNFLAHVRAGAKIKVISKEIIYYETPRGWVSAAYVTVK